MNRIKEYITNIVQRVMDFYEDQNLLEEKMFWGVVPLTTLVGLISLVGTIFEGFGIKTVICAALCTFVPMVIAFFCYMDHNKCRKYYVVFCFTMNCILIPLTFLVKGGLISGMPLYCFGFLLMCSFCANRHDRHWTCSISFVVYVVVFVLSVKYPQIVSPIPEYFRTSDIFLSYGAAAISMIIIISEATNELNKQKYREVNEGLIDTIGTMIEFRSLETGNHIRNISRFTTILLRWANKLLDDVYFSKEEIESISAASMLHDIGKIASPDTILQKPGKLTDDEYSIMKKHPLDGCQIIQSMKNFQDNQYYKYCYEICRHHHERYDGTGYPDGLKGDEIPLISQIVCLADVYEALTAKRVYKEPCSPEKAASIILESEGTMFSKDMIRLFVRARPELEELVKKNR